MKNQFQTTSAFPEPNYTQTPNDFFAMIPDMECCEVKVTLIMIRETFGYHRGEFKMGIGKLMEATGMSRNSVCEGAELAEKRGTFKRSNPGSKQEAEWELIVESSIIDDSLATKNRQPLRVESSTVDDESSTVEGQSPYKERNKTKINNASLLEKKPESTKTKVIASPKQPSPPKPPSRSALLMKAFEEYWRLSLNMTFAAHKAFVIDFVDNKHATPEMIAYAKNTWDDDEIINWHGKRKPSLSAITETWLDLIEGFSANVPSNSPIQLTRESVIDMNGI